jgi:protein-disulfide isomerase
VDKKASKIGVTDKLPKKNNFFMSEEMQNQNTSSEQRGFFDGNPRTMFTFGLVSGMAVILLLNNFVGLSSGTALARTTQPTVVAAGNNDDGGDSEPKKPAGALAPVTNKDHVRGDLNKAKVVLVEYSDFQCPYCGKHHPTMEKVMEEYGDDVAWVYRHFPLSFHPNAEPSAIASECAAAQGKFWEFADAMFESQVKLSGALDDAETFMSATAKSIGLNTAEYEECYSAGDTTAVDAGSASGETAGVNGTPATFVNGTLVSGAVPYTSMKKIIDDAIAKAK